MAFTQEDVNNWFAANPNATTTDVARAVQGIGGLDANAGLAGLIGQHYGTDAATVNTAYNQWLPTTPSGIISQAAQTAATPTATVPTATATTTPAAVTPAAVPPPPPAPPTFSDAQIQNYVSGVLGTSGLNDWQKINNILEKAQETGIDQSRLASIYGQDALNKSLGTYKSGINNYITQALATDPTKTTFDEIGQIHQAANKYGLTPDELAKYGGMDTKTAQSYFDMFNQGLGSIVSQLNTPNTTDLNKTQTALALEQKYGATDADIAKASNGKYTTQDVKNYLDPVRNFPATLQNLMNDPNATAQDILKTVQSAKADERLGGLYGAGLDKVAANAPLLSLRDGVNGSAQGFRDFLTQATATPEASAKYAPQIASVQKLLNTAQFDADRYYGGKVQDYQVQLMSPLNTKKVDAPQKLDITPAQYETRTGVDPETGEKYTYQGLASNAKVNNANVVPTYDEEGNVNGYTTAKEVIVNGVPVSVNYDTNGNITGYVGQNATRVFMPGGNSGSISGKWDANGNVLTQYHPPGKSGGFLGGLVSDVASMGPVGMIALAAATGGLGSLAAEAMGGGLLANAAGSGLVSGALSSATGGSFGKGFTGGALGNLAGNYVAGLDGVSNMTGNPMVDNYLKAALPNLASTETRAALNGQNLSDAGIASLLNTGINQGSNALINAAVPNTLTPGQQKVATGVGSGLVTSAITGKPINLENSILNYAIQNAMSAGKQAVKG